MLNELTIVMYHYVRPIANTEYPNIKGLELRKFYDQLDYLEENYSIIHTEELIKSIQGSKNLPKNACWLTFDDGYKDHIKYVMPELKKRKISGAFFPPKVAIEKSQLLDVNSIHFILNNIKDIGKIVTELNDFCKLEDIDDSIIRKYYKKYAVPNKFDDGNTIYVKRMLQNVLPEKVRKRLISKFFNKYLGVSQKDFSYELYMDINDIKNLIKNEMYVGSHGSEHKWLDKISDYDQNKDIALSLEFLEKVGASTSNWIMCYPYGAYNNATLKIIKKLGAIAGVTTNARKAIIGNDNPLTLPRFDTNDFL